MVRVVAPRSTVPDNVRLSAPDTVSGEPAKMSALPTVRAPPEANTAAVLPNGSMVNGPVPIGPETGSAELIPKPMAPSELVVPPEYVLAAVKMVLPPVPAALADRLNAPVPEITLL